MDPMIVVTPDKDRMTDIAQRLLAVADYPSQVQVVTYPARGFMVPESLFKRFKEQEQSDSDDETPQPARRRGRPRKTQESKEE